MTVAEPRGTVADPIELELEEETVLPELIV